MMRTLIIFALGTLAALCLPAAFARKELPCDKGFVHQGAVTGAEVKFGDLDAYIAYPKKVNGRKYPTVVFISDIFGWKLPNARQWVDKMAGLGFLTVMPDFFRGDPWTAERNRTELPAWFAQFTTEQVLADIATVQKQMREKGVNGYKASKFGAQGFCWGGFYSDLLVTGIKPAVNAAIVYHGSRLTLKEIEAIKKPVYFLKADPAIDNNFPFPIYNETVKIFEAKRKQGIDARIKYYPGMAHGFTVRGDPNNATIAAAAESAFNEGAQFLAKYLK